MHIYVLFIDIPGLYVLKADFDRLAIQSFSA